MSGIGATGAETQQAGEGLRLWGQQDELAS